MPSWRSSRRQYGRDQLDQAAKAAKAVIRPLLLFHTLHHHLRPKLANRRARERAGEKPRPSWPTRPQPSLACRSRAAPCGLEKICGLAASTRLRAFSRYLSRLTFAFSISSSNSINSRSHWQFGCSGGGTIPLKGCVQAGGGAEAMTVERLPNGVPNGLPTTAERLCLTTPHTPRAFGTAARAFGSGLTRAGRPRRRRRRPTDRDGGHPRDRRLFNPSSSSASVDPFTHVP
jgi:hypothetical protein